MQTHLAFSDAYSSAVESKQVAQQVTNSLAHCFPIGSRTTLTIGSLLLIVGCSRQEAERAKYIKDKAEQEKRGIIIRAQGEGTHSRFAHYSHRYSLSVHSVLFVV